MKLVRVCTVDGCDKTVRARGVCDTHYHAMRRAEGYRPPPRLDRAPRAVPSLVVHCGDCGAVVGLVATPAGVWGALAAHTCEAA